MQQKEALFEPTVVEINYSVFCHQARCFLPQCHTQASVGGCCRKQSMQ